MKFYVQGGVRIGDTGGVDEVLITPVIYSTDIAYQQMDDGTVCLHFGHVTIGMEGDEFEKLMESINKSVKRGHEVALQWRETLFDLPPGRLGELLREYIFESEQGNWEGFTARDVRSIYKMLRDMELYYRAQQPDYEMDKEK